MGQISRVDQESRHSKREWGNPKERVMPKIQDEHVSEKGKVKELRAFTKEVEVGDVFEFEMVEDDYLSHWEVFEDSLTQELRNKFDTYIQVRDKLRSRRGEARALVLTQWDGYNYGDGFPVDLVVKVELPGQEHLHTHSRHLKKGPAKLTRIL